jgi:hypothetical protein
MSSDSFYASPDAIKSAGADFAEAADSARRISENLDDTTSGLNPIAGNDVYGQAFSSAVLPSIKANSQVLLGAGDGFNQVTTNLDFTASSYTKANETNTDLAGNMYT